MSRFIIFFIFFIFLILLFFFGTMIFTLIFRFWYISLPIIIYYMFFKKTKNYEKKEEDMSFLDPDKEVKIDKGSVKVEKEEI